MRHLLIFLIPIMGSPIFSQVENSNKLILDSKSKLKTDEYKLSTGLSKPKNNFTLYDNEKLKDTKSYSRENNKKIDMTGDNGLLEADYEYDAKKDIEKDDDVNDKSKKIQFLGNFESLGKEMHLVYRDHQAVDGDVVRIFINKDVVRGSETLGGTFKGFKVNLIKGENRIDIQALNQGTSGPNTAEFQLYDDQGNLITSNIWNLLKGGIATIIVNKK